MALLKCPDCGAMVSDKAKACHQCGCPVEAMLPATAPPPIPGVPATPAPTPARPDQGSVGLRTQMLICPGCGSRLSSKDIISSEWARCPACNTDVSLEGINGAFSDAGIVEKIYPFEASIDEFHQVVMQQMMDQAPADFFARVQNLKVTRNYFWVREFSGHSTRELFPMCDYGKRFFMAVNDGKPIFNGTSFNCVWDPMQMKLFSTQMTKGTTLKPKEMDAKDCKQQYSTVTGSSRLNGTDYYYCIPVIEEEFDYDGKHYSVMASGDKKMSLISYTAAPEEKILTEGKPKYTDMTPITITVGIVLAIIAILIIIGVFASNGIIGAIFTLFIIGIVVSIVGAIAMVPLFAITAGADKAIQLGINAKRRSKFRAQYGDIQQRKQKDARQRFNLDLKYEVPEFPLLKEDLEKKATALKDKMKNKLKK